MKFKYIKLEGFNLMECETKNYKFREKEEFNGYSFPEFIDYCKGKDETDLFNTWNILADDYPEIYEIHRLTQIY